MKPKETKVTTKYQTTIPEEVRKLLGVEAGKEVEWSVVKSMVIVDVARKVKNPVKFLTSQTKLDIDAVKLVKEAREDFR
ncbi:MAG: AbrB/MazE/SpoVT family DNA-binding domain-containing protein [Candidatus Aenigmarchaeota archaeon]|nr:AbrB/MazE/SpoVT family DNA-binding domain-containing protein [Candidatus Aenigmarchaeota archaeon]